MAGGFHPHPILINYPTQYKSKREYAFPEIPHSSFLIPNYIVILPKSIPFLS